jgi:hypothetical protein
VLVRRKSWRTARTRRVASIMGNLSVIRCPSGVLFQRTDVAK